MYVLLEGKKSQFNYVFVFHGNIAADSQKYRATVLSVLPSQRKFRKIECQNNKSRLALLYSDVSEKMTFCVAKVENVINVH